MASRRALPWTSGARLMPIPSQSRPLKPVTARLALGKARPGSALPSSTIRQPLPTNAATPTWSWRAFRPRLGTLRAPSSTRRSFTRTASTGCGGTRRERRSRSGRQSARSTAHGGSPLNPDLALRQPRDINVDGEHTTRQRFDGQLLRRKSFARRGDVERLQILAAEGGAGRPADRHFHHAIDAAIGGEAAHRASGPLRVPDVAGGVDDCV